MDSVTGTATTAPPFRGTALERTLGRALTRWPHYSLPGVVGAMLFGAVSFTPSLVPRDWLIQGVVSGFSAVVGYAFGVVLAWLVQAVVDWRPSPRAGRRLRYAVAAMGLPLTVASLWLGQQWQQQIHQLVNLPPPETYAWVRILLVGMIVFVAIVALGRALRAAAAWLTTRLLPLVPDRLAHPLAIVILVTVMVGLNNGVIERGLISAANAGFGAVNGTTDPGTFRSMVPERSGSPESFISWDSLGRQGRNFIGTGPGVGALERFSGEPAMEPVRVYAGLRSAEETEDRAELAVRDLERAGGFDREVLVVATSTGTGFVDPSAVDAVEYLHNGDTAVVSIQYSYLPSWLSFLVDDEKAREAGRELFNAVHEVWAELPSWDRPLLLVNGTSMGVFGSEGAFSGEADLLNRVDGAVWAGTPNFSPLHGQFVEERDPGSPEWLPVYDDGRHVRFMARPGDLDEPGSRWEDPRIVYVQYGSDAVVRWSPRLAFTEPDWLEEPPAPDVSHHMTWIPVVTFWQVSADLPSTYPVPDGAGHRYSEHYADAWAAVAAPEGWTDKDTARLRTVIRQNRIVRERILEEASAVSG